MKTPVLMVHGMCCTGEVWSQFRSLFETRGAKVYTPTLRPEQRVNVLGKPPRELRELTLNHYVEDLEREVKRIEDETGERPAVIGHSMGGLLAQALAERNRVAAAVFVSPATPAGSFLFRTRMFWSGFSLAHSMRWTPRVIRPDARSVDAMVLNMMPPSQRKAIVESMVFESGLAFANFANYPIDENKVTVPVLTIAAKRDRLVPAMQVRLTSKKYAAVGGEFREYASHGHWLYAEPGWEKPANEIFEWLELATDKDSVRPPARSAANAALVGSGL